MKKPNLRNLSRGDLLEILIQQGEELDRLRSENEEYRQQLQERTIHLKEAGSIAEAALKVSGVFDAAQEASDRYYQNLQALSQEQEELAQRARDMLAQTQAQCAAMREEARQECARMLGKAKIESLEYWAKAYKKLENNR